MEYNLSHDLSKIDKTMYRIWIECTGNNNNKSYLVGILQQSSLNEKENRSGQKNLENYCNY